MESVGLPENPSVEDILKLDPKLVEKEMSRSDLLSCLLIVGVNAEVKWDTDRMRKKLIKIIESGEVEDKTSKLKNDDMMLKLMQQQQTLLERLMTYESASETASAGEGDGTNERGNEKFSSYSKVAVRCPDKLEDNCSHRDFQRWLKSWRNYASATNIAKMSREQQVSAFFSYVEPKMLSKVEYAVKIPIN